MKIPRLTVSSIMGDKTCGNCKTRYMRCYIREVGLLHHGLFYANCKNCNSMLVVKENPNEPYKEWKK